MPMLLRSRKSLRAGEPEPLPPQPQPPTPAAAQPASARRRSTRLQPRVTYEDSDESDSESVQSQVMEARRRPPEEEEEEEEAAEDTQDTEETGLKHCSVMLDRLRTDINAAKTELEEREDMNRKGGKLVSRIPTFHKRPATAGQSAELPVTKKDLPSHVAPEKASPISMEHSKPNIAEAREKALPPPSIRVPRFGVDSPSYFSSTEQAAAAAYSSPFTATKDWSLSGSMQSPPLAVTPRPALRTEPDFNEHCTEGDTSDTTLGGPVSLLPCEAPPGHKAQEDILREHDDDVTSKLNFAAPGDSLEVAHTPEVCQVDAIMDEEPPWKVKATSYAEPEGSRSSSDADFEEDSAVEEPEHRDSGEPAENYEPLVGQPPSEDLVEEEASCDQSTSTPEKPAKDASSKSTKRSGCSSFARFCFLPTLLLLLGGFGQHIWHYGLPLSVVQLTAQLELHWLEGFGLAAEPCSTDCRVHLVESIPEGLYPSSQSSQQSIADSWLHLLDKANSSVHIAAFYLTLRDSDLESANPTDSQGKKVFEQLKKLHSKGVKLQVAVNAPQTSNKDTSELAAGGADVREVDLNAVTGGIIHTKLWVVDQKHVYLGSANMDWRSLSQVKEVGLSVEDCSCLAQDASRIFGVYWSIGGETNSSLPPYWPARFSALSSSQHPLHLKFNGVPAQVYLSSAPPQISARGRSDDLTTILSVINDARKFISISVMDYLPMSQYTKPIRFWPDIDTALRAAACTRRVNVQLLISCWPHSSASMFTFLQSLVVLNRHPLKCHIEVKIFTVPSTAEQSKIPFARVNHAKYMVTDRVVYIGTSNWSENYFTQTAGVGLVVNQTGSAVGQGQQTLQSQVKELFFRDWQSDYARELSVDDVDVCPHGSH